MQIVHLVIIFAVSLFIYFRAIHDKKATYEKFLKRELEPKGLKLISSQPCKNPNIPEVENIPAVSSWEERRIGIGTMIGGRSIGVDSTYKVIRKVEYKDKNENLKEAYAAIEFSGFFIRRFLGVSWNPEPN